MLRAAVTGLAMTVLVSACALVEPPPPPGTTRLVAEVTNTEPFEVELAVTTPSGILAGVVQPSRLPPRGTGTVTFYVPSSSRDWTITVNGTDMFYGEDIDLRGCTGGTLYMEVSAKGGGGIGCRRPA
jgi:hypothetical protein